MRDFVLGRAIRGEFVPDQIAPAPPEINRLREDGKTKRRSEKSHA
jgi:hypothetical protein